MKSISDDVRSKLISRYNDAFFVLLLNMQNIMRHVQFSLIREEIPFINWFVELVLF